MFTSITRFFKSRVSKGLLFNMQKKYEVLYIEVYSHPLFQQKLTTFKINLNKPRQNVLSLNYIVYHETIKLL